LGRGFRAVGGASDSHWRVETHPVVSGGGLQPQVCTAACTPSRNRTE
jgi:hypothetical protein